MSRARRAAARLTAMSAVLSLACFLAGPGAGTGVASAALASPRPVAASPQRGGTMTVLETAGDVGAWPVGLDPATNTSDLADDPYMEAIYGDLFEQGNNGKMIPDLATGYKLTNGGKDVSIFLRHGVKFQDGTPFNATAVAWNIRRDLDPKNACICDSSFPVGSVTTPNRYTVVLHLTQVYAPIIQAFAASAPNWIASPTAVAKMGEKAFALKPVGAGPFQVVSDTVSSILVLKKYAGYWQKGHPYLENLTFKSIGSDQSAYNAILAGQAQFEQQVGTFAVVQAAKKNPKLKVSTIPGTGTLGIQLNTTTAPFDNIKAREAMYYATDPDALNRALSKGTGTVSQSGDGPASLFPILKVPGYRTYDLAKAKALVTQLGGLSFTITSLAFSDLDSEALQSEWQAAGMKVSINSVQIAALNTAFKSNSWQVVVPGGCGGTDPAIGLAGMSWRCLSTGPFTGIHDHYLDTMINEGTGTIKPAARAKVYEKIFAYLNQKAYIPFTYSASGYVMAATTAHGPGVDTAQPYPFWGDAWIEH